MQYPTYEIEAYFAGDHTAEQLSALEAWINADLRHARDFFQQLHFRELVGRHVRDRRGDNRAVLAELARLEAAQEADLVTIVNLEDDLFKQDKGAITANDLKVVGGYLLRHALTPKRLVYGGLAAAVLLGLTLVIALQGGNTPSSTDPQNLVQTPGDLQELRRSVVATLTAEHDAQWGTSSAERALARGSSLHAGQRLTLTAGFAEFTTNDSAVIILEAPCTVEMIDNDNAIYLHAGKLVGVVESPQAKGFQVRTPNMFVTDLGTHFGIHCTNDGSTVRVIEGQVLATPNNPDAQHTRMTAGQSAFASNQTSVLAITEQATDRFVTAWDAVAEVPVLTGDIRYEPSIPSDLRVGAYESPEIRLFKETTHVVLSAPITVNVIGSGRFENDDLQEPVTLVPTTVDSYVIHLDTLADEGSGKTHRATIRFDRPIVGIITSSQAMDDSHRLVGLPDVLYGTMSDGDIARYTGLDQTTEKTQEIVEISDDRRTLTLQMATGISIDQARVLVESDRLN